MRLLAIALLATTTCSSFTARPSAATTPMTDEDVTDARSRPNVAAARELDREGVRTFRDGHYADAIRYFRMAYRLGGPSTELWNIARTRERLDDPEGAERAIGEYLAQHDLSPQDRADAEREARTLRSRPSMLSVTTSPGGAFVNIDGKQTVGPTPVSVEVPPGPHRIAIRLDGYIVQSRPLEARFGRAVIVSLDLVRASK